MQAVVKTFFEEDVSALVQELVDLDARIDASRNAYEDACFHDLTRAILASNAACRRVESSLNGDAELLKDVQNRYREAIAPWFDRSWFMHRAKVKPRGYPGDYELLAAIYDGVTRSRGLAGYLDLYFLNTTLGRAVPARMNAVRDFLAREVAERREDLSILNVACGPCREYVKGLGHLNGHKIHVTCVDNDEEALEYVKTRVVSIGNGVPEMECVRYNALRMSSAKANLKKFGTSDVIYSVGLCDYLPDKHLAPILRGLRESLADGGVLYVAFKDAQRYDTVDYQWLVDWFFLERTEPECRGLFERAGLEVQRLAMERDATGVIMNFAYRTRRSAAVRIDAWQQTQAAAHPVPASRQNRAGSRQPR
ncbi:MAG: class I SAM-dependent methyltransferase [Planctomycetota bacterium]|jgi:SAM-dependent methyltransferase